MGQKTHPVGFRLGIIKDWQSKWYANKPSQYRALLQEDLQIRSAILSRLPEAGISRVELERSAHELVVTIYSARPGIVIGRGGQRVEEVRKAVEIFGRRGFVLGVTNSIRRHFPWANTLAMIDEWKRLGDG